MVTTNTYYQVPHNAIIENINNEWLVQTIKHISSGQGFPDSGNP